VGVRGRVGRRLGGRWADARAAADGLEEGYRTSDRREAGTRAEQVARLRAYARHPVVGDFLDQLKRRDPALARRLHAIDPKLKWDALPDRISRLSADGGAVVGAPGDGVRGRMP